MLMHGWKADASMMPVNRDTAPSTTLRARLCATSHYLRQQAPLT